jgi:hypothetical protein
MTLKVIGAGLPRTGTESLRQALGELLDGRCYHMRELPGHPFDLGQGWRLALAGGAPDWEGLLEGYVAAVDWPAAMFWWELSEAYPDALVLLSVRNSAETWYKSADATILPYARMGIAPDWSEGRDFVALLERFAGTEQWNDPAVLMAACERHNAQVRQHVPADRLLEWRAEEGWEPICHALGLPVPDRPFPWTNRRSEWG